MYYTFTKRERTVLRLIGITAAALVILLITLVCVLLSGSAETTEISADSSISTTISTTSAIQTLSTEPTSSEPTLAPVHTYYDVPLSHDLQDYIFELCEQKDVPVALIFAMIECESSFRPDVISGTNDYGLMQINTINHEEFSTKYGITDFLDPYQNVFCGITIISGHYAKYGDVHKALMAYNFGPTGARRHWDKGVYTSTYSEKIVNAMDKYIVD